MSVTHAADFIFEADGPKRVFTIAKKEDGGYVVLMRTWWDGEENEPFVTRLQLTEAGYEMLITSLLSFKEDYDLYPWVDEEVNGEDDE